MLRLTKKKFLRYVLLPNVCLFIGLAIYFPGAQLPIALTLATAIHGGALQAKIDACEAQALEATTFTNEDKSFLLNLYTCLYKGARLTIILPEVSRLMEHYLGQSGEPLNFGLNIDPKSSTCRTLVISILFSGCITGASQRGRYAPATN